MPFMRHQRIGILRKRLVERQTGFIRPNPGNARAILTAAKFNRDDFADLNCPVRNSHRHPKFGHVMHFGALLASFGKQQDRKFGGFAARSVLQNALTLALTH